MESISRVKDDLDIVEEWERNGMKCMVRKHQTGFYCGYVQTDLPPGAHRNDLQRYVDVHFELTYGVDQDGWVGFDCAHLGDISIDDRGGTWGPHRTITAPEDVRREWRPEDVADEVNRLADQIAELWLKEEE